MSAKDLIAVCSECKSDQPDKYIENNVFYQQGSPVPCKYCSGIVLITRRGDRKTSLNRSDSRRAIGHNPDLKQ